MDTSRINRNLLWCIASRSRTGKSAATYLLNTFKYIFWIHLSSSSQASISNWFWLKDQAFQGLGPKVYVKLSFQECWLWRNKLLFYWPIVYKGLVNLASFQVHCASGPVAVFCLLTLNKNMLEDFWQLMLQLCVNKYKNKVVKCIPQQFYWFRNQGYRTKEVAEFKL